MENGQQSTGYDINQKNVLEHIQYLLGLSE